MKIYNLYSNKVVDSLVELLQIVSVEIVNEVASFGDTSLAEHRDNLLGWKSSTDSVRNALSSEPKIAVTEIGKERFYVMKTGTIYYDVNSDRHVRESTEEEQLIYKVGLEEISSESNFSEKYEKDSLMVHIAYNNVLLLADEIGQPGSKYNFARQSKRIVLIQD